MTLHFIHPEDEFRECDVCCDRCDQYSPTGKVILFPECHECNGTGKIRTDAKPEIEIQFHHGGLHGLNGYYWAQSPLPREVFASEDEARSEAEKRVRRMAEYRSELSDIVAIHAAERASEPQYVKDERHEKLMTGNWENGR